MANKSDCPNDNPRQWFHDMDVDDCNNSSCKFSTNMQLYRESNSPTQDNITAPIQDNITGDYVDNNIRGVTSHFGLGTKTNISCNFSANFLLYRESNPPTQDNITRDSIDNNIGGVTPLSRCYTSFFFRIYCY